LYLKTIILQAYTIFKKPISHQAQFKIIIMYKKAVCVGVYV